LTQGEDALQPFFGALLQLLAAICSLLEHLIKRQNCESGCVDEEVGDALFFRVLEDGTCWVTRSRRINNTKDGFVTPSKTASERITIFLSFPSAVRVDRDEDLTSEKS